MKGKILMNNVAKEIQEIKEKVSLMHNDGIILEIPMETHINRISEKIDNFSDQSYTKKEKSIIDFMKALNNPNRLRIIQLLKIGVRCSCELEFGLKLSQPTISHHVNILENANIVQIVMKGKWKVIKLIESPVIFWVLDQLR